MSDSTYITLHIVFIKFQEMRRFEFLAKMSKNKQFCIFKIQRKKKAKNGHLQANFRRKMSDSTCITLDTVFTRFQEMRHSEFLRNMSKISNFVFSNSKKEKKLKLAHRSKFR